MGHPTHAPAVLPKDSRGGRGHQSPQQALPACCTPHFYVFPWDPPPNQQGPAAAGFQPGAASEPRSSSVEGRPVGQFGLGWGTDRGTAKSSDTKLNPEGHSAAGVEPIYYQKQLKISQAGAVSRGWKCNERAVGILAAGLSLLLGPVAPTQGVGYLGPWNPSFPVGR